MASADPVDLNQPQPDIDRTTIHAWAGKRLPPDIAEKFTDWLNGNWPDWDPEEAPAINILQGALEHWRGYDPDDT